MRRAWRAWWAMAAALAAVLALIAGCGVTPTGVRAAGQAPGGVAPGPTLYFVDSHEHLQPQLRPTEQLGTIAEALSLLLAGSPGDADLHSEIWGVGTVQVTVTMAPGVVRLMAPLAFTDVTALGIEQIVCTALGVDVQRGGARSSKVQIVFTQPTPESDTLRTCPLISPGG
ncbi:hypothetical protein [Catenulispora pinisilvae]|uniref:hypothetical protein n=1 Tax=Catenulispora pinisilvae TaxID=2705253 RepID=UPI001E372EBA|nr:hypothetical protein [Catenulispora pinisilvae]